MNINPIEEMKTKNITKNLGLKYHFHPSKVL